MTNEILCPYCQELMPAQVDSTACPNGHEFDFNYAGMIFNATRELRQREQVPPPRLVDKGTMRQAEAEHLKALQAQTIVILQMLSAIQPEFAEFLQQKRGAAPALPPHHDPLTEVIR